MRKASFAAMPCSLAQALDVVGEWWTLLIVRDAFFGVTRFEDFARRLGIARNVLAARLDKLVDEGVLERVPYDEARARFDYHLTPKGRGLLPVLTALRQWGDEWVTGPGNEPIAFEHEGCGGRVRASVVCGDCGAPVDARTTRVRPGPGAPADGGLVPVGR